MSIRTSRTATRRTSRQVVSFRAARTFLPFATLVVAWSVSACRSAQVGGRPVALARADSAARAAIANERALTTAEPPLLSVGVVPFSADPTDTLLAPLSFALADLLATDLTRVGRLQVVERVQVDALLRELALARSGRVDSASAPRVARLLSARRLVVGSLTRAPTGGLGLEARVVDAPSARVEEGISAVAALARILEAQRSLAVRVHDLLGVTLTPAERAMLLERPTGDLAALLAYGRGVRAEAAGDWSGAAGHFRQATQIDPGFTLAAQRLATLGSVRIEANRGQAQRAASLAGGAVNAGGPTRTSGDAVDGAFQSLQQVVDLIVRVRIP